MALATYIHKRAGSARYYVRVTIPADLTKDYGRSEIWKSLGTASPAFGSRELVYLPYPGEMVTERETMTFTYVSLSERADIDLTEVLAQREDR